MAWVRIHDDALSHPKLLPLFNPRDPVNVWLWGLTYAQRFLTDGFIAEDVLPRGAHKAVTVLVTRRLWVRVEGGYQVHDYLDWNDSKEVVRSRQDSAKARQQRWLERVSRRVSHSVKDGEPNQTKPDITHTPTPFPEGKGTRRRKKAQVGGSRRWSTEDCTHDPVCGSMTVCENRNLIAAAKAARTA